MKKILLIVICVLLISSVTAISNKDRIIELLTEYEEECLEWKYIENIHYERQCLRATYTGSTWMTIPECDSPYKNGIRQHRIVERIKTDKCLKWHLIRLA